MLEPKNPIIILKEGKEYPASYCYRLEAPFRMRSKNITIEIQPGEKPVYFARKQKLMSIHKGVLSQQLKNIKYRIGKISLEGKEQSYWLNSKGEIIEQGD